MPPKIKITREEIVNAAVQIVRSNGADGINARDIAAALNCSTQPVFSNFANMDELRQATIAGAYSIYLAFIQKEVAAEKYPVYKAYGMAYIHFAKEERELFKLLFMRDRTGEDLSPTPDFQQSVQIIMDANGITEEAATLMHMEMWACVHGIGTMMATSFLSMEMELVSDMLTDVYQGVRARYLQEDKEK